MAAGQDEGRDPVTDHEVAVLVKTLRSYGVLSRDSLHEHSDASRWPDHSFEVVLRHGVANGSIKQLSEDMFEAAGDGPDLDEGRFDPT